MTIDEVARLLGKSRRTIMRLVYAGKLPNPIATFPMSFDEREVRAAIKRTKEGNHGPQSKNGRTKRGRAARVARAQDTARRET
jgi:predicted DNA-binding transcriptional regulator AlpA